MTTRPDVIRLLSKRRSPMARQRGAALLIVIFIAAIAVMSVLIGKLNPVSQKADQLANVSAAQLDAKNTVLGYVRTNGGPAFWGLLPLPDMGKRDASAHIEGESATNFGADGARGLLGNGIDQLLIGRLPRKTLGINALRDNSGNCLWYALSAAFKASNAGTPGYVPTFNWDTLGDFDTMLSNNPHDSRAVAIIFAAGSPTSTQDRAPSGFDSIAECGGNYMVGNYLENLAINPANPTTDGNQAVYPLAAAQTSPDNPPAAAITLALPANTDVTTDHVLAITASEIFNQTASAGTLQSSVNTLLPLLKNCLETQNLPSTGLGLINLISPAQSRYIGPLPSSVDCSATITGSNAKELLRWRDNFWYLTCSTPSSGCLTLTDTTPPGAPQTCDGLLVFSGSRTTNQCRANFARKNDPAQYLESTVTAFGKSATNAFCTPGVDDLANPAASAVQARSSLSSNPAELSQDVALCLTRPVGSNKVELDNFQDVTPDVGGKKLVYRDIATDILTLGDPTLPTSTVAGSAAGCTFSGDTYAFGNGVRFYFRFKILDYGDGFTFALIDAERNVDAGGNSTPLVCGGAGASGQFLGYAGRNLDSGGLLVVPPIEFPKIGLEFDTARNSFGASNVGDTTNSHVALVYWGRSHDWPDPPPVSPYDDDNTHLLPPQPQLGYQDPLSRSAFGYPPMRYVDPVIRDFHVRFEIERIYDGALNRAQYMSRVWIREWNNMIPGMDNLDLDFSGISTIQPDHRDPPLASPPLYIYNLTPGVEAFRLFRFGFTNAQSLRTQQITVQDIKIHAR